MRKSSARRHALLSNLQELTSAESSVLEQEKMVGRLYATDLSTIEECLLQVAHVCITVNEPAVQELLQGFMLWLAGRSFVVALRLSWTVTAVSDFFRTTGLEHRVKEILDSLESCAINQVSAGSVNPTAPRRGASGALRSSQPSQDIDLHALDLDTLQVRRKEQRLKLYNDERNFITTLTDYSDGLRFFPDRSRRKDELRKRLRALNETLDTFRLIHPLGDSAEPVKWIVHIAVEECTVFSSRERAPYLIRYEVIVDDTATMQDPSASRLRLPDGRFKVSSTGDAIYDPAEHQPTSSQMPDLPASTPSASSPAQESFVKKAFGESSAERLARVRASSPWGAHPNWGMRCLIVKAGDDLRQEELALQMIDIFNSIWQEAGLTCSAHPYRALPTNSDCGVLEVVDDSNSMDGIKKACGVGNLQHFFAKAFDGQGSIAYRNAQRYFAETMAGYSVISYILQIKDRHNGNLMISRRGEIIHIDFGFLFVTSPGGINFESAPFKLSQELIDVMDGQASDMFTYYKVLVYQAFEAARERAEDLLALVALMVPYNTMPCFGSDPKVVVPQLRSRFRYDLFSEADFALNTKELISTSADNWRTRRYDQFQTMQNGIL